MKRRREGGGEGGEGGFNYSGWSPQNESDLLPVVDAKELSPDAFYADFIAKRRPVRIRGTLEEEGWRAAERWDASYLRRHAGDANVKVEQRSSLKESFGKGKTQSMRFGDFVKDMAGGKLYMTSQDTEDGELFASPIRELHERRDFPLRPRIIPGLVPANISLWMGSTSSASSSGLHHDYHDNLYILLEGSKKFTLYSPEYAQAMRTNGAIDCVHPNGMISYVGHETHADGSTEQERRRLEAKAKVLEAERDLQALEDGCECDPSLLEAAEGRLDEALDMELSLEAGQEAEGEEESGKTEPRNFSSLTEEEQGRLKGKCKALEVCIGAGEMLYLPCGWFHNVTSCNSGAPYHLALNYWFYPPDNESGAVKDPYSHRSRAVLWESNEYARGGAVDNW
ncbi:JmjC domain-containing protein [Chloropicon primus]|uniref:JmjC domain-containing protein n=1 Tax=Chloropicon primus TaxID=1764295 RepID=A0A5B8MQE2_9CHLO|nr:hypothetical protein A3770_08p52140 [Chloropicon primus]UPR01920.1 JmjC domain-containing protein [Chloropicon primus]|eukprot:QDZ22696.1 hypothetical protein A3770_08p52140 [Chloropicon primus]